jgi:SAM-dependent methyltransferase
VPYQVIARELAARPDWVVGDFGCGEALLAGLVPNRVLSFDHVAINERVTACDMAHTPLEDGSLDVVVFSLSLMGSNWREYLAEAHRVLKPRGQLYIAETRSRWEDDKRQELMEAIRGAGFRAFAPEERDRFLYIEAVRR